MQTILVPEYHNKDLENQQTYLQVFYTTSHTEDDLELYLPGINKMVWIKMEQLGRLLDNARGATMFIGPNESELSLNNLIFLEKLLKFLSINNTVVCIDDIEVLRVSNLLAIEFEHNNLKKSGNASSNKENCEEIRLAIFEN